MIYKIDIVYLFSIFSLLFERFSLVYMKIILLFNKLINSQRIMDVSNSVINSFVKELYAELVIQFMRVCVKYLYFLKYVEIAILD